MFIFFKGFRYRQKDCLELCQQKFYLLKCNCTLVQYFSLYARRICNTVAEMDCAYSVYFDIINKQGFHEENCYPLCPLECVSTSYNAFITYNQFCKDVYLDVVQKKTNFLSKYDNQTLDITTISKRLSRVNIYYDSLSYTLITESVSMNIVSLVAAIGGFMGMFLGMSLMTLVEMFEIFLRIILNRIKSTKHAVI